MDLKIRNGAEEPVAVNGHSTSRQHKGCGIFTGVPNHEVMKISVLDTSICSDNLGDQIIMDAARAEIAAALPLATVSHTAASHTFLKPKDYFAQRDTRLTILGGTNALKSHMFIRGNWKVTPIDIFLLRNVVLLGVGWQQYQGNVDPPSRQFFKRVLSKEFIHSVRDTHSLNLLSSCVDNVVNTSCPTLWGMDADACSRIPLKKSSKVIFALTYYSPSPNDIKIFRYLKSAYEEVYFWPQQPLDIEYARSIGMLDFSMIEPSIEAYNTILETENVDFVGARLHGGIRALQKGRRTLILAVDNRAKEIQLDTNIPAMTRDSLSDIKDWVDGSVECRINLPTDSIKAWKSQFEILSLSN